jgi:NAD dependent epimerase/dehydratase family enzyme
MQSISADKPLHDERPALKLAASEFSQKIGEWWEKNAADITDIGVRMPVIVSSVALLKLAGAEMSFATPAVFALVGGPKIVEIFKRKRK